MTVGVQFVKPIRFAGGKVIIAGLDNKTTYVNTNLNGNTRSIRAKIGVKMYEHVKYRYRGGFHFFIPFSLPEKKISCRSISAIELIKHGTLSGYSSPS